MKQIILNFGIATFLSLIIVACNTANNDTETNANDTAAGVANTDTSSMPAYDPALDPWNVEAPFAKKFGDTLGIKMFEVTLKPGDSVALHRHPDHTLYVVQGGKISITTQGGGRQELELPTGAGFVNATTTHSGKNIGNTTVRLLVTDIHRPRGNR
jgi:quercetin dioxygenase-like cupin family protein